MDILLIKLVPGDGEAHTTQHITQYDLLDAGNQLLSIYS
jgi:hypothetical protein